MSYPTYEPVFNSHKPTTRQATKPKDLPKNRWKMHLSGRRRPCSCEKNKFEERLSPGNSLGTPWEFPMASLQEFNLALCSALRKMRCAQITRASHAHDRRGSRALRLRVALQTTIKWRIAGWAKVSAEYEVSSRSSPFPKPPMAGKETEVVVCRICAPQNYTWPGSSWRPSVCEADVIATRPQVLCESMQKWPLAS